VSTGRSVKLSCYEIGVTSAWWCYEVA